jgi:hypothetical protein
MATTVLVLGIIGLFFNILAPVAWVLGNQELEAIRAGRRPAAGESNATLGRILGMIGTGLLILGLVVLAVVVVVLVNGS